MPGKVDSTQREALTMVCCQVASICICSMYVYMLYVHVYAAIICKQTRKCTCLSVIYTLTCVLVIVLHMYARRCVY